MMNVFIIYWVFKIPGETKKLYLSAILDLYDRYPVAYVISSGNEAIHVQG